MSKDLDEMLDFIELESNLWKRDELQAFYREEKKEIVGENMLTFKDIIKEREWFARKSNKKKVYIISHVSNKYICIYDANKNLIASYNNANLLGTTMSEYQLNFDLDIATNNIDDIMRVVEIFIEMESEEDYYE